MTALLVICTGKYDVFLKPLLESADKFFLSGEDVTYFVFSDKPVDFECQRPINVISTEHRKFPQITLDRYEIFSSYSALKHFDYLYYCDADMLFVDNVGTEIYGKRVATIHPGYLGGIGKPERRAESTAYIPHDAENVYYAGGFNGGSEYLDMCYELSNNIRIDSSNGILAIWHDESHMNRYFYDNPPDVVLSPSYCYPESWNLDYPKKLLALDKDHATIR